MTGTSTCVLRSSIHVVLGPCTGGSDTKWHFASDGVNFGPVKHQVSLRRSTACSYLQTQVELDSPWSLELSEHQASIPTICVDRSLALTSAPAPSLCSP